MPARDVIAQIKAQAATLPPAERAKYVWGLLEGLDFAANLASENLWPLASNETFLELRDWLNDQEPSRLQ